MGQAHGAFGEAFRVLKVTTKDVRRALKKFGRFSPVFLKRRKLKMRQTIYAGLCTVLLTAWAFSASAQTTTTAPTPRPTGTTTAPQYEELTKPTTPPVTPPRTTAPGGAP